MGQIVRFQLASLYAPTFACSQDRILSYRVPGQICLFCGLLDPVATWLNASGLQSWYHGFRFIWIRPWHLPTSLLCSVMADAFLIPLSWQSYSISEIFTLGMNRVSGLSKYNTRKNTECVCLLFLPLSAAYNFFLCQLCFCGMATHTHTHTHTHTYTHTHIHIHIHIHIDIHIHIHICMYVRNIMDVFMVSSSVGNKEIRNVWNQFLSYSDPSPTIGSLTTTDQPWCPEIFFV
jgi:hypothetical protein